MPPPSSHARLTTLALNSRAAAICAAHPFWRAPVTREQVEGLVSQVREQPGDALVFVDDHFKVVVESDREKVLRSRALLKEGSAAGWPDGLSPRRFYLDTAKWGARRAEIDPLDVYEALKAALDAANGGAGPAATGKAREALVGKWKHEKGKTLITLEFTADTLRYRNTTPGAGPPGETPYKVLAEKTLEMPHLGRSGTETVTIDSLSADKLVLSGGDTWKFDKTEFTKEK
jgi:hypothetical protein